jgi:hypothetical protein
MRSIQESARIYYGLGATEKQKEEHYKDAMLYTKIGTSTRAKLYDLDGNPVFPNGSSKQAPSAVVDMRFDQHMPYFGVSALNNAASENFS